MASWTVHMLTVHPSGRARLLQACVYCRYPSYCAKSISVMHDPDVYSTRVATSVKVAGDIPSPACALNGHHCSLTTSH